MPTYLHWHHSCLHRLDHIAYHYRSSDEKVPQNSPLEKALYWRHIRITCFNMFSVPGPEYESPWDAEIYLHVLLQPVQRIQLDHFWVLFRRYRVFIPSHIWNFRDFHIPKFCSSILCGHHFGFFYHDEPHFSSTNF